MSDFDQLRSHGHRVPPPGGLDAAIRSGRRRRARQTSALAAVVVAVVGSGALVVTHHRSGPGGQSELTASPGPSASGSVAAAPSEGASPSSHAVPAAVSPTVSPTAVSRPPAPITVYVINTYGNPLADVDAALVDPYDSCTGCGHVTDDGGAITLYPQVAGAGHRADYFFYVDGQPGQPQGIGSRYLDCATTSCTNGMRVTMPTAGDIAGQLLTTHGLPVTGATVTLTWAGAAITRTTDSSGRYDIGDFLGPASYELQWSAPQECSQPTADFAAQQITVVSGQTTQADYTAECSALPSP